MTLSLKNFSTPPSKLAGFSNFDFFSEYIVVFENIIELIIKTPENKIENNNI
jgi:hypothetical protein